MSALASPPVDMIPASAPSGTVVMVGNCRYWFADGTAQADIDKLIGKAERVASSLQRRDPKPQFGGTVTRLREPSKLMLRAMADGDLRVSPTVDDRMTDMPKTTPAPVTDLAELEAIANTYRKLRDAEIAAREELHASMRALADAGVPQSDIARATGWHRQHVHRLLKR